MPNAANYALTIVLHNAVRLSPIASFTRCVTREQYTHRAFVQPPHSSTQPLPPYLSSAPGLLILRRPIARKSSNISRLIIGPCNRPSQTLAASSNMTIPYFDPLGETEPSTTKYILTVKVPPRPPPRWLPSIFTNKPSTNTSNLAAHKLPASDSNPNFDRFELGDVDVLNTKVIVVKSACFPPEMRCPHVQKEYECKEGCYFLEKGGDVKRFRCERADCEGHVYCGRVMKDDAGRSCFGKTGERMVCLQK
jgi:hypothetical protein